MVLKTNRAFLLIACSLPYLIACALPVAVSCVNQNGKPEQFSGLWLLSIGWMGPLLGQFAWFANVFNIGAVASLLVGSYRTSIGFSIITLLVSLDTFAWHVQEVYLDEGGVHKCTLDSLSAGAYFWFLALLAPLFLSLCMMRSEKKESVEQLVAKGT